MPIRSLVPAATLRDRGETRIAEAKADTVRVREARLALARRSSGAPRVMVELNGWRQVMRTG